MAGARQGKRVQASLASSTRFLEVDAFAWSNNAVRVMARSTSAEHLRAGIRLSGGDAFGGGREAGGRRERAQSTRSVPADTHRTVNNS